MFLEREALREVLRSGVVAQRVSTADYERLNAMLLSQAASNGGWAASVTLVQRYAVFAVLDRISAR